MYRDVVWEAMPVMYGNVCLCERNVGVRMTMGVWKICERNGNVGLLLY